MGAVDSETVFEGLPGPGDDRRADHRYRTVYRVARVARGGDAGLWRVRNISDHGMMLLADVPVEAGEKVRIHLSERVALDGRIVWSERGRCGAAFDARIDSAGLLQQLARERQGRRYRPLRVPVEGRALATAEGVARTVRIVDLSQAGMGFAHDGDFHAGVRLTLLFEPGVERHGVVRWSADGRAWVHLATPFACAELESARRFYPKLPIGKAAILSPPQ